MLNSILLLQRSVVVDYVPDDTTEPVISVPPDATSLLGPQFELAPYGVAVSTDMTSAAAIAAQQLVRYRHMSFGSCSSLVMHVTKVYLISLCLGHGQV